MEFQVVNEISSFWNILIPPFFLGTISLLLFLWVLGKQNRESLMKWFIDKDSNQYVFQNGLYIPKVRTVKYILKKKFFDKLELGSLRPLIAVFLVILFFFGLNQILLQIFQPLLTYNTERIIYSSGVDDYILANIWSCYPDVKSSAQLYEIVMELTEGRNDISNLFLYSTESFIRFDLVCCFIMFFRMIFFTKKSMWMSKKVFSRLFIIILVLMVALVGNLFFEIQNTNRVVHEKCDEAFLLLLLAKKNDSAIDFWNLQRQEIEEYQIVIKQNKEKYGVDLYYGAFGIRNRFQDFIISTVREFQRFFQINNSIIE